MEIFVAAAASAIVYKLFTDNSNQAVNQLQYPGYGGGMQAQQYVSGPSTVGGNSNQAVNQLQYPGYGGGMQAPRYITGPSNVGMMPWSNSSDINAIYRYFRHASLAQLLAMLVDGVYARDQKAMDIPLFAPIEGHYEEDVRTEEYTSIRYWTRMAEISPKDEKKLGLRHYLRIDDPIGLQHWNPAHRKYRLVIALRGTKLSSLRDIVDDIKVAHLTLHCSARYKATQRLIENILATFRKQYHGAPGEVCITGHSLGAAIALLIGKDLAKDTSKRYDVHCFNPPLLSVLMLIKKFTLYNTLQNCLQRCEVLKPVLRAGSAAMDLGKFALAIMFFSKKKLAEEFRDFRRLKDWTPTLYVNKRDIFCKEYERFYERRNGCPNLDLPISMQALVSLLIKRNARYSCLVPSVDMYVCEHENQSHRLKQWFMDPSLQTRFRKYRLLHDHPKISDRAFNVENVVRKVIRNVIDHVKAQIAETGTSKATRSLVHHAEYLPHFQIHSLPPQPVTEYLPRHPAMHDSLQAPQPAACSWYPGTHQPVDYYQCESGSLRLHDTTEASRHLSMHSVLHETREYSRYGVAQNDQDASDRSDYDEEFPLAQSAEAMVLESYSAHPLDDPGM